MTFLRANAYPLCEEKILRRSEANATSKNQEWPSWPEILSSESSSSQVPDNRSTPGTKRKQKRFARAEEWFGSAPRLLLAVREFREAMNLCRMSIWYVRSFDRFVEAHSGCFFIKRCIRHYVSFAFPSGAI